jgi:hypothetical protein
MAKKLFSSAFVLPVAMSSNRMFVLDPFGLRQFNNPQYTGTQVNFDPESFEKVKIQFRIIASPISSIAVTVVEMFLRIGIDCQ